MNYDTETLYYVGPAAPPYHPEGNGRYWLRCRTAEQAVALLQEWAALGSVASYIISRRGRRLLTIPA